MRQGGNRVICIRKLLNIKRYGKKVGSIKELRSECAGMLKWVVRDFKNCVADIAWR